MITEQVIKRLQEIYNKRFGEQISYDEALAMGTRLLELIRITHKPLKKNEELIIINKSKKYER